MPTDAIDQLLEKAIDRAKVMRRLPVSTYRLQFHKDFTFRHATKILPYLAKLGITHVYASPYLAATAGSTHGYDVIDHCRLNPEVGSTDDYNAFLAGLAANGLAHILDTVPNHVGVATNDNTWWNDVLEHGPASKYASYFDITWRSSSRPELADKVLIPTLGKPYGAAVDAGELQLSFDPGAGRFWVNYYQRRFPVSPHTYDRILCHRIDELQGSSEELLSIVSAIRHLPLSWQTEPAAVEERARESEVIKSRLGALAKLSQAFVKHLDVVLNDLNGTPGEPASFDRLDQLLDRQCFRLADWHVAFDEINYRRFFDVNDLAALSMERPEVFEAAHAFILPLLAAGKIAGLRIDHPDGLYDPAAYLKRLQQHYLLAIAETIYDGGDWAAIRQRLLERLETFDGIGQGADRWPLFVSVEKILAMDEPLIADWATHGTSGYDFLVMLNGLFVEGQAETKIDSLWRDVTGDETDYEDLAYRNKRMMMESSLASELHALTHRLDRISQRHRKSVDFSFRTLQTAVRETVACFGVYRTYVAGPTVTDTDRDQIVFAIDRARTRNPRVQSAVFDYLRDMLLQKYADHQSEDDRHHQQRFTGKFQQLTSPVTAKGIEDTTFYQFNRFLSLNEVGGEPAKFGVTSARLHQFLQNRRADWPFAISGSSTHDTKRSEDVRARLNVLSDLPDEWAACVKQWFEVNAPLRGIKGVVSPAPEEEILIYQTLLGAWPLETDQLAGFADRVQAYMLKAIREAKMHTRWGEPDEAHEAAVAAFVAALLDPKQSAAFHQSFDPLLKKVTHFGLLNSLSQTLLKAIAPGVPDTYQGTELWDFSLVDPDNRRPVNYGLRERHLASLDSVTSADLLRSKNDGRIKLKVTAEALRLRRTHAELFARGDYMPLAAKGDIAHHLFGFTRSLGGKTVAVIVPRGVARLCGTPDGLPIGTLWEDTQVSLPAADGWKNVLTGQNPVSNRAADLFGELTVALLISETT